MKICCLSIRKSFKLVNHGFRHDLIFDLRPGYDEILQL